MNKLIGTLGPSRPPLLKYGVEPSEFDPGVGRGEPPADLDTPLGPLLLPGFDLRASVPSHSSPRSRPGRASTLHPISATFPQLPCFGL
jgi:hypothetical protein